MVGTYAPRSRVVISHGICSLHTSGNQRALWPNNPAIFDPAVYFGDREADPAMTGPVDDYVPGFHVG